MGGTFCIDVQQWVQAVGAVRGGGVGGGGGGGLGTHWRPVRTFHVCTAVCGGSRGRAGWGRWGAEGVWAVRTFYVQQ